MAETLSLMEFLQALLADAGLRGAFGDDPQGTLAAHGLADLTPADVHDALVLVQDTQTVDYSLDAASTAPQPPPPAGDGHEAAVEYLARYLAGPEQTDPAQQWTDPDDVRLGGFGAGDDAGYGAGSDLPVDDSAWATPEPQPDHRPDDQIGVDLEDFGHLVDFDEFTGFTGFTDVPDDIPDGHDGGPTLPEGA
ncbi:IniB N-terminal domain-containing protein [Pseudonocardia sp. DSM 110487]|uniref:IniB N-terminal domain-containing protein n=1 Tax=Pseudonocardia sp. DSM 110487 TaxID=2865833 RepID=UPI001C6A357D|nr:IniB N-terminal domain-containing protein [Pseudonocardia sp. DSM 110487]QYN35698.1 IniB N-terminal domain-containing protein [Pseudonocardia sp. DSM 110487]